MDELTHIHVIIAKIQAKLQRQQKGVQSTLLELDHWKRIRAEAEKGAKK